MSATTVPTPTRAWLVAVGWILAILVATMLPGGGLVASIAAVSTTYKSSSPRVKVLLVAAGVATVLIQVGTFVTAGTGHTTGPITQVQ